MAIVGDTRLLHSKIYIIMNTEFYAITGIIHVFSEFCNKFVHDINQALYTCSCNYSIIWDTSNLLDRWSD